MICKIFGTNRISPTSTAKPAVNKTAPAAMSLTFSDWMKVKIRKHIYDIFKNCVDNFCQPDKKTANNNHSHSASVKENKKPNTMAVTPNATCLRILRSSRKTV